MRSKLALGSKCVLALLFVLVASTALAAEARATKVLIEDGSFLEIENTGIVTAVNRLATNDHMPPEARTEAVASVLGAARAGGMLVRAELVAGDVFLALDSSTGYVILVSYTGSEFALPSGATGFSRFFVPA